MTPVLHPEWQRVGRGVSAVMTHVGLVSPQLGLVAWAHSPWTANGGIYLAVRRRVPAALWTPGVIPSDTPVARFVAASVPVTAKWVSTRDHPDLWGTVLRRPPPRLLDDEWLDAWDRLFTDAVETAASKREKA